MTLQEFRTSADLDECVHKLSVKLLDPYNSTFEYLAKISAPSLLCLKFVSSNTRSAIRCTKSAVSGAVVQFSTVTFSSFTVHTVDNDIPFLVK